MSDNSGIDKISDAPLGKRYDVVMSEVGEANVEEEDILQALLKTSETLMQLAEAESKS